MEVAWKFRSLMAWHALILDRRIQETQVRLRLEVLDLE